MRCARAGGCALRVRARAGNCALRARSSSCALRTRVEAAVHVRCSRALRLLCCMPASGLPSAEREDALRC
jgi:hypothetical protein